MVDLVKLRKKAKEKKGAAAEQQDATPAPEVTPAAKETQPAAPPAAEAAASAASPAETISGAAAPPPVAAPPAESGKLEHFKRTANLRGEAEQSRQNEVETESEQMLELLLFNIAGEQYALPIEKIIEIVPPRRATRVPNADASIVGIISLRGTIVSILDIRRKLGHPPLQTPGVDSRIIVLENAGETAGFLVDKVSRVVRVEPNRIGNHPVVSMNEQSEFIRGVFQHAQRLSILLELETLLRY